MWKNRVTKIRSAIAYNKRFFSDVFKFVLENLSAAFCDTFEMLGSNLERALDAFGILE